MQTKWDPNKNQKNQNRNQNKNQKNQNRNQNKNQKNQDGNQNQNRFRRPQRPIPGANVLAIFSTNGVQDLRNAEINFIEKSNSPYEISGIPQVSRAKIHFVETPPGQLPIGFQTIHNKYDNSDIRVIACPITFPRCIKIIRDIERVLSDRIHHFPIKKSNDEKQKPLKLSDHIVDLSNLEEISPYIDLRTDFHLVVFIFGVFCIQNQVEKEVYTINYSNNPTTSPDQLIYIQMFFPNVTSIIDGSINILGPGLFPTRRIVNQHGQIDPLLQYGFDAEELKPKSWFGPEGEKISMEPPGPPPNLIATQTTPISQIPGLDLTHSEQNQFPTTPFVIELFNSQSEGFYDTESFYAPTAFFSLTVEHCSPSCLLSQLLPISRNLFDDTEDNIIQGPDDIKTVLTEAFPDGLSFSPSNMITHVITDGLYAVVLSGIVTPDGENNFLFDRSMIIGVENETILITNDHLFIAPFPKEKE